MIFVKVEFIFSPRVAILLVLLLSCEFAVQGKSHKSLMKSVRKNNNLLDDRVFFLDRSIKVLLGLVIHFDFKALLVNLILNRGSYEIIYFIIGSNYNYN